jgi:hypothetical protein
MQTLLSHFLSLFPSFGVHMLCVWEREREIERARERQEREREIER